MQHFDWKFSKQRASEILESPKFRVSKLARLAASLEGILKISLKISPEILLGICRNLTESFTVKLLLEVDFP